MSCELKGDLLEFLLDEECSSTLTSLELFFWASHGLNILDISDLEQISCSTIDSLRGFLDLLDKGGVG